MKTKYAFLALLLMALFVGNAQEMGRNLLLHYEFDGDFSDSSGNGYDATNFGATLTTDRRGNPNSAALFDGVDDYINFPNVDELKPEVPMAFAFWIRFDSNNPANRDVFNTSFEEDVNTGVYFNSQASTGFYAISYGDGEAEYTAGTRRTYITNTAIETGRWKFIVILASNLERTKIYVNGVDSGGEFSVFGGQIVYSDLPGAIGRHDRDLQAPANYFKGAIDDFRYWDRRLSPQDILSIYNEELGDDSQNIVMYPNPSNGKVTVQSTVDYEKIAVYSITGDVMHRQHRGSGEIDLSFLKEGLYYVKFYSENVAPTVKKLLIKG